MGVRQSTLEGLVTMDLSFFNNKTVLVTGHTGFKGSWMARVLKMLGAKVVGYSLMPLNKPNLFELDGNRCVGTSIIADIRDIRALKDVFKTHEPEIVIHMAAQPLVLDSYREPVYTYDVNVMGTVNILECARHFEFVKSFVNVTTDKVYKNNEWVWGYRETDELNGYDPYSNSKSCSELVTSSYLRSFFHDKPCAISTVRAGNVIGGGDFAKNRIMPDCARAAISGTPLKIRNPYSIRPYQHVLEPICAYLLVAMRQYENKRAFEGQYNVAPRISDCVSTQKLVELFKIHWDGKFEWEMQKDIKTEHEANYLRLDCSKITAVLGWLPKWDIDYAVKKTADWTKCYVDGADIGVIMQAQIEEYLAEQ